MTTTLQETMAALAVSGESLLSAPRTTAIKTAVTSYSATAIPDGSAATSVNNRTSDAVVKEAVDSALLSGLRDSRERLGLLKLEQVLIDFCNDPNMLQLDIGGPMNSSVIRPPQPQQPQPLPHLPEQAPVDVCFGTTPMGPATTANNSSNHMMVMMTLPPKPATTFQRCLLHRLADRFAISRQPQDNGYIRIFKTPATKVPPNLLLHVKPSEWSAHYTAASAGTGGEEDNTSSPTNMAGGDGETVPSKAPTARPKKMKIMKRQTSSTSSTNANKESKARSKTNTITGQTEKERQYAEARARIFQQSQEDAWKEGVIGDDTPTMSLTMTNHQVVVGAESNGSTVSCTVPAATPATTVLPHPASAPSALDATAAHVPATATTTTVTPLHHNSKATYRNRLAEQADPDFQRRTTTLPPTSTTTTLAAIYGYGTAPGMVPVSRYPPSATSRTLLTPSNCSSDSSSGGHDTVSRGGPTTVNGSMAYGPTQITQQQHHQHHHPIHHQTQNYYYAGSSLLAPSYPSQVSTMTMTPYQYRSNNDHNNHNGNHQYNQPHQQQKQPQRFRRWHSDSEKAADSVPSIHSSKDFPSLQR